LILSEGPSAKVVQHMVEGLGDVPLGVFVKGMSEEKINELASLGCDFVVFDIKAAAAVLHEEKVGKFLMIELSLDQGFVRAINSLEVDGVFISSKGGDACVTVEHLLVCRRLVEILEKPVIMTLPSLVTKAELTNLWQTGVDGIVAPLTQSVETLAELKKMIGDLPKVARGHRAKVGVRLPHYGRGTGEEEDEEQEEEI
jgi:citrate lyase beta subunit